MSNIVLNSKDWACPELGKSIDQLNWLSGGMLYDVEADTRFKRWNFFLMKLNTFVLLLELFYFNLFVPFDLLNFIITGIQITLIFAILFFAPWKQKQRSNVVTILNWMAIFRKREYPIKKKDIKKVMKKADKYSMLCVVFVKWTMNAAGLILAFVIPSIGYFVMDGSYTLPFNAHLPFLPPNDLIFYLINYIHQAYVIFLLVFTCAVVALFSFTAFLQMIYCLKTIKVLAGNMSRGIKKFGFHKWHKSIIETTIEVKRHMKIFSHEVFSSGMYVCEKLMYTFFVVLWLAYKTDRRLLPWAMIGCSITLNVIMVVVLSEMALDEFNELNDTLYDQPWLELSPKERRSLQMTMIQFQRPICLTTGLQDVTYEWLVNLAKAGYSMGVVMDKLIKR